MVVTVRDGRIVRMQDHRSREDALAGAGLAPKPALRPPTAVEPGADRVSDLIPFVPVADVEDSIAFYEHLGFRVTGTHPPGGATPLGWAWLESDDAGLMLQRTGAPIDRRTQAVVFYLYSRDLWALRQRLLAADVAVVEIVDGSPGPRAEMRVEDPDGYVLMIAQVEADDAT
jgi:catechol 2,3-dioxygenase-like lactoylglutathione lyase family enzyme